MRNKAHRELTEAYKFEKPSLILAALVLLALVFFYLAADSAAGGLWALGVPGAIVLPLIQKDDVLAFRIGSFYLHTDAYDLQKAEAAYRKAFEINPRLGRLNYQLGRVAFLRGDFDTARHYLDRELELYPEFPRSYYMRGLVNGYAGKYDEAIKDFEMYMARDPSSWAVYNDLAWIHFKLGNYQKVAEFVRKGLEFKPDNVWLLTALGAAIMNLGDKEDARRTLERALELAERLEPRNWIAAYPANDPRLALQGLAEIRRTIRHNLSLVGSSVDN